MDDALSTLFQVDEAKCIATHVTFAYACLMQADNYNQLLSTVTP
jgi:hypothetical protein